VPEYYQFVEITFSSGSSSDSDGNLVGWRWWFDGALVSTSPDWITTFDSPRDGTVKLQVMDDDGVWSGNNSRQFRIVANTAPTAAILLTPTMAVEIDALVTLNGSGTDAEGYIAGWEWSLDGVVFATTQNATVSSNITGAHTVMLTVTDDGGLQTNASAAFMVKMPDVSEQKYFEVSVSPINAAIGEDITIDLSGTTGPVAEFEINYGGDIKTTQNRTVTISFDATGTYNIDISVSWSDGSSFDSSRDYYTTTVTVSRSGDGGTDGDGDGDDSDGSGGGIPGPGLLAALAGLGLAARRKR
jgi:PKD repeat protein